MSKIMQIKGQSLTIREVQGQRVVTIADIADLHHTKRNNIVQNFNRNKDRFIPGTDYLQVIEKSTGDNLSHSKYYFTESGYLMLVKSLTDDLSWEVQRMLVNTYFRASMLQQMLSFLPEQTRKLIYYRGLGLTQKETGKLLGVSGDVIQKRELQLKKLGYTAPNLTGQRNSPMFAEQQMELPL